MSALPDKFWWVWRFGGGMPTIQHRSRAQAEHEAQRLARQNPHDRFVVLEAVSLTKCVDVETFEMQAPSDAGDLPF